MAAKSKVAKCSANLGFEATRWLSAYKLGNNIDFTMCKHLVFGPILLKCIYDCPGEHHTELKNGQGELNGANSQVEDNYRANYGFHAHIL